ncbi:MAG TPA: GNAT family N-acetyltransferase [Bacillales bacterium]|nr:GNAT family N-acetyltransferase [Bacillales bacterium]
MLTNQQLEEIKELQKECESADEIQLKLNWDMLQERSSREITDFFHFEDGVLVGFLGLYGFGNKVELCGMVKPDYRRKGIFTKLFSEAMNVIEKRGFAEILLNAPTNSSFAKSFLRTVTCDYAFTEYQMQWQKKELCYSDEVSVRPSTSDDLEDEILLDIKCFGLDEAGAREFNLQMRQYQSEEFYIIEQEGQTVGKIRVSHLNEEAWIFGFCVDPEYQGKGIGRRVLTNIVLIEKQKGYPIFLEVEANNLNALGLYESCGFQSYYSQDYYTYNK